MKKFRVKSLPLKDVLQDLAEEFNTEVTETCDQYRIEIPESLGEGYIEGINFSTGLGIIVYNVLFHNDVEIHFNVNDIHPAKFLYCTEGSLVHTFEHEQAEHVIDSFRSAIVASSGYSGHVLRFHKNSTTRISSLEINREVFGTSLHCDMKSLSSSLQKLLSDFSAKETFYHEGDYSLYIADCLYDMDNFEEDGMVKKLFLSAKSYQILTLQILQYEDDLKDTESRTILRRSELDKILEAIRIIQQELPDLDNVSKLAQRVGTNESKLQSGFRNLTGSTVNQYIQNARLDAAKELLISSDLSISEIVYSIGLSSRGYFSSIFKEKYKVSPSVFRKGRGRQ